jgi:uncharacterized membrane protein YeaQ/YmgE (transglycosylase-associated protein family)
MDPITIIGWIIFGLIVGAVARLLIPGRDPMGWIATIVLGVVGSLMGGFIGYALLGGTSPYAPAGWILSIVGAVVTLLGYYFITGAKRMT